MFLARVEGTVVATHKHPSLAGQRLLICTPIEDVGKLGAVPIVAMDPYGAAKFQTVLVSTDGAGARKHVGTDRTPARHMIVGIVDVPAGEKAR